MGDDGEKDSKLAEVSVGTPEDDAPNSVATSVVNESSDLEEKHLHGNRIEVDDKPPAPGPGIDVSHTEVEHTDAAEPEKSLVAPSSPSTPPPPASQLPPPTPTKLSGQQHSLMVFVVQALESINNSKEGKKKGALKDATTKALDSIKQNGGNLPSPTIIYEPLQLACHTNSTQLIITALDCFSKLISFSFFVTPPTPETSSTIVPAQRADARSPLMERVVDTICGCMHESSVDDKIQLQILKALGNAVLNEQDSRVRVHSAALLKCVRTVYNCSILGSGVAGAVAQGTLSQIINAVFSRVRPNSTEEKDTEEREDGSRRSNSTNEAITLQSFERGNEFDKVVETPSSHQVMLPFQPDAETLEKDEFVKDAFLVFRSLCKISVKAVSAEHVLDMRSTAMRSKMLTLQSIHELLTKYMSTFTSLKIVIRNTSNEETAFIDAIKQYLCVSLSRNAFSTSPQVFEISVDIFWLMIDNLRGLMKKEIEVFMNEMVLHILELRSSGPAQKEYLVRQIIFRLCQEPKSLVELYLNYDCDSRASTNIYERCVRSFIVC